MDIEALGNGFVRDWTDIQHVYDLIANEDASLLEPYDPIPDFNEDLVDVFASSFGLPVSPLMPSGDEVFEPPAVPAVDLLDPGPSQLKQLLLTKPKPPSDLQRQKSEPTIKPLVVPKSPRRRRQTAPVYDPPTSGENAVITRAATRDYVRTQRNEAAMAVNKIAPKTLKFPPCFICGGKASGLHYGVNSCEACKGFFRRYLIRNEEYKCPKGGNCQIVNRNRENCSGCRLQKCFELGMSKEKSKLGRYTLSRRTETIRKVKALEKIETKLAEKTDVSSLTSIYCYNRDHNYSEITHNKDTLYQRSRPTVFEFSSKLTGELVKAMEEIKPYGADITTKDDVEKALKGHYERYKAKIETYGEMKSIPKHEYYKLLKEYGIDIDGRMSGLRMYVREIERVTDRYCNFAKMVPGFKQLSRKDQSALLKADRCDFFIILMNDSYSEKYKTILSRNGLAYNVEEIADKHFSRGLLMKVCETYQRWQNLSLTKEEKALIIAMTLFFTDRCKIEDYRNAERLQLSLVELLRDQLEKTYKSHAMRRFSKIIDCLTFMRESSEMYLKEYKQLCDDETIVEAVPMLTEFLLDDW